MKIAGHDIGVCSWSLRPNGTADLVEKANDLGLDHVQLALEPLLNLDDKRKHQELGHLRAANLAITATMIGFPGEDYTTIATIHRTGGLVPDDQWPLRKQIALQAGKFTAELGVQRLSFHAGFIPPSSHESYRTMIQRLNEIATPLADLGVGLLLETGQETAENLLQFLNDLGARNVGVNFDPANMILYGAGNPIAAVRVLGRHIRHVHIKDATLSDQPGRKWGEEVPFGTGQVNPAAFLAALKDAGYTGPLSVEREAGDNRVEDVRFAIETLKKVATP